VGGAVLVGQVGGPGDDGAPVAQEPQHRAAAIYFVGRTPDGPRLYREFQSVPAASGTEAVTEALDRLEAGPEDPDYRTVWPAGSFTDVSVTSDQVVVSLGDAAVAPTSATRKDVDLGIQQVVFTAEAGVGRALPVVFEHDGAPAKRVLGAKIPTRSVGRAAQDSTLAPVNISDPSEGSSVDADFLVARGTVLDDHKVRLALQRTSSGDLIPETVETQPITDGSVVVRGMRQWESHIDVSSLGPGTYILVAQAPASGSGRDPLKAATDTRTFVVR
jgi:hypothetical protein